MGFVVVTVADNGIVHVYGTGKIGPDAPASVPFEDRRDALRVADRWRREGELGVSIYTCKILGNEPSDPVPVTGST